MFVGSKFCPHCGEAAATVDDGPAVGRHCPRCETSNLQSVDVGGVQLEECPDCGGLWVAVDVFNRICADRVAQEAAISIPLPPPLPQEHGVRYLKCPRCGNLMNRYKFANRCGVILEECKQHGVWLDRDDLRRVIEFIRAGGLAAAREQEIQQLKEQTAHLESMQHIAGFGAGEYGGIGPDYSSHVSGSGILSGLASLISSLSW